MIRHMDMDTVILKQKLRSRSICLGGNHNLKIYGRLDCASGKRMKKENRVFFQSEEEAIQLGYRPCGHCLKKEYKKWKEESALN